MRIAQIVPSLEARYRASSRSVRQLPSTLKSGPVSCSDRGRLAAEWIATEHSCTKSASMLLEFYQDLRGLKG